MMGISHSPVTSLITGLVYERVELGNLKYCLKVNPNLPPLEWLQLILQVIEAAEFLHESGIIHQGKLC